MLTAPIPSSLSLFAHFVFFFIFRFSLFLYLLWSSGRVEKNRRIACGRRLAKSYHKGGTKSMPRSGTQYKFNKTYLTATTGPTERLLSLYNPTTATAQLSPTITALWKESYHYLGAGSGRRRREGYPARRKVSVDLLAQQLRSIYSAFWDHPVTIDT